MDGKESRRKSARLMAGSKITLLANLEVGKSPENAALIVECHVRPNNVINVRPGLV